jgi:hypothetical protein
MVRQVFGKCQLLLFPDHSLQFGASHTFYFGFQRSQSKNPKVSFHIHFLITFRYQKQIEDIKNAREAMLKQKKLNENLKKNIQ